MLSCCSCGCQYSVQCSVVTAVWRAGQLCGAACTAGPAAAAAPPPEPQPELRSCRPARLMSQWLHTCCWVLPYSEVKSMEARQETQLWMIVDSLGSLAILGIGGRKHAELCSGATLWCGVESLLSAARHPTQAAQRTSYCDTQPRSAAT